MPIGVPMLNSADSESEDPSKHRCSNHIIYVYNIPHL